MEIGFTDELRNKIAETIQNIDPKILDKSISIEFKQSEAFKYTQQYETAQANKIYALNYFFDLVDLFNEIRYSAISAECCRELLKKSEAQLHERQELGWRFKYYVDSAIYRYYSYWEYVGRFFNEYFDLKLDVDKKDNEKEKDFYFARQVLNILIKEYSHKILVSLLELWAQSKEVFDYRIVKTHKRNTRIGEEILKLTKERSAEGRTLKFDVGKDYSGDDLLRLLKSTYKNARLGLGYISEIFEKGHDEFIKNSSEKENKSHIIIPDTKTILQFQKIIKSDSLLIKLRK
ncbi:MAG: hypothetical protein KF816_00010 [Melioribacteraceae bacterium]|nr:hypothetical protein [Melioribacteraceae bacterium]